MSTSRRILSAYGIEVSQNPAVSKNSKETASKKLYCRIFYLNSGFQLLHITKCCSLCNPKINPSPPPKKKKAAPPLFRKLLPLTTTWPPSNFSLQETASGGSGKELTFTASSWRLLHFSTSWSGRNVAEAPPKKGLDRWVGGWKIFQAHPCFFEERGGGKYYWLDKGWSFKILLL